jgi:hypothetical protein
LCPFTYLPVATKAAIELHPAVVSASSLAKSLIAGVLTLMFLEDLYSGPQVWLYVRKYVLEEKHAPKT